MDILYPCSLCSHAFTLREHFLMHMKTAHSSSVPLLHNDDTSWTFNCTQCYKQFNNKSLLKKHVYLKHNSSTQSLSECTSKPTKKCKNSHDINDCLFLKELLPDSYSYKILAYKDLLFGQFKVKFQINNMDKEAFLDWLNNLCHKSRVNYTTENIKSNSLSDGYHKLYRCKNCDYWNQETNSILKTPINCKASLSVVIKSLSEEPVHQTTAIILMNHCHYHPMNDLVLLKPNIDIRDIYNPLTYLIQNGHTAASVLHEYKMQILQNEGKHHYLNLSDSGNKPDVEFVYDIYYMHIKKNFSSPFVKRAESLMDSVNFYNSIQESECAVVDYVDSEIVVSIRTPLMKTDDDTVLVCSTSFNSCKTWFMFSKNELEIIIPVGVIISTDDKECLLKAGLETWKRLGGNMKTVVVEFIHRLTFQSVFPNATVCVSKFHFLLGIWKWLFSVTKKNNLNDELNCFVELKKIVCSENFIVNHCLNKNFVIILAEKYPNFKHFMQKISPKSDSIRCSPLITNPCSTISERKLVYYCTKSLSIIQMFHFVIDEIELLYEASGVPNSRHTILNELNKIDEAETNFTYYCIGENSSMYLVENVSDGKFFVDMDIGLCSCTINNVCAPCVHQMFLNKYLNDEIISCSTNACTVDTYSMNHKREDASTEKPVFETILSEFQSVNLQIREQFLSDPNYFKDGIESFVSTLKNNLTSEKSLFLACHSLGSMSQSNLDKN